MTVLEFSPSELERYTDLLRPFRLLRNYRYFFSSREWIRAHIKAWGTEKNYLVTNGYNYAVLSEYEGVLSFCGNDLNDYNGFCNVDATRPLNLAAVRRAVARTGKPVHLTQLFEPDACAYFTSCGAAVRVLDSVHVLKDKPQDSFQSKFSDKIIKMQGALGGRLVLRRCYAGDVSGADRALVADALAHRMATLLAKQPGNPNSSLLPPFNAMLLSLLADPGLRNNQYIDLLYFDGAPAALGWNFTYTESVLYYVRTLLTAHKRWSLGLLSDFLSAGYNDQAGVMVWDFLRGTEAYKYRVGGVPYPLQTVRY